MRIQLVTALLASLFTAQSALAEDAPKAPAAPLAPEQSQQDQEDQAKPVTDTADASDVAKPVADTADYVVVRGRAPRPYYRQREYVSADVSRFRGGIALEGGVLAVPRENLNFGLIGVQGQLGVQVNNQFGIYAVPSFDIGIGHSVGGNIAGALMFDLTAADFFTFGVGPDVGVFLVGNDDDYYHGSSTAAGAVYGGRVHLAINPIVARSYGRRTGLTIGLDTRFLGGAVGTARNSNTVDVSSNYTGFIVQPMLTIGFQTF